VNGSETVSLSRVIAAIERMGYTPVARHGELISYDTLGSGGAFPIILDMSKDPIPLRDIAGQIEEAGDHLPVFYSELEQV